MAEYRQSLATWLSVGVALVFLGLYVTGLASGAEPERALLRAGLAGILLGGLARVAVSFLDGSREMRHGDLDEGDSQYALESAANSVDAPAQQA